MIQHEMLIIIRTWTWNMKEWKKMKLRLYKLWHYMGVMFQMIYGIYQGGLTMIDQSLTSQEKPTGEKNLKRFWKMPLKQLMMIFSCGCTNKKDI
jgi:hypothetical protein